MKDLLTRLYCHRKFGPLSKTIIESVIKVLKTQTQLEYIRHRNFANLQVNVFSALIAYLLLKNKPSVNPQELSEISDLPMLFNY
ncbi:hypothetical protein J4G07_20295 [Candidatus Poribacteria bacterium]|nr:hypothetical protein [Candidatus Poribacteria bacterium]